MDYLARSDGRLHGGEPVANRDDRNGFDQLLLPNGLQIQLYDDGRVKVGGWHYDVAVVDVSNHVPGESGKGSGHIIARFARAANAPDPALAWANRTRRVVSAAALDVLIADERATTAPVNSGAEKGGSQ